MAKQILTINDFDLFCEMLKSTSKIVDSAKFEISQSGIEIYGARAKAARCEITSNAVISQTPVQFSIENLQLFLKIVQSVKDVHDNDYSNLKFTLDMPFIRFESKKFKTKFTTCNESIIAQWISKKITAEMTPVFEFTGSSDMIKRLNQHSFMFSNPKDTRIYLETHSDMENNSVFALLGNKETALCNEIMFKFGLVTAGSLIEKDDNGVVVADRKIILDFERLNLFNAVQSNAIKFQFMNLNCLVSRTSLLGKNGTFFNLNLYSTVLKN